MQDIREIISRMTLREKAEFCTGEDFWHLRGMEKYDVPRTMLSDGPHGLRKQDGSGDHLGINDSIQAVCFPSGVTLASSFDRGLLRDIGETLGNECAAEDVSVLLGPAVNIKRSPLCGRNFEYLSEDPYLSGELGTEYVKGVQSNGVGVSLKHFAVNNQEKRRSTVSAVVDDRALREVYLRAFEKIVKEARPWTVMCSYNKINGVYSSQNPWLMNNVLRGEWGFDGYVVTDWGAACDRVEGVKAGVELEMPSSGEFNTEKLVSAVQEGTLDEKVLDSAVERILNIIKRYEENKKSDAVFDRKKDHAKAREIAGQCMVLLKNEGALPLKADKRIAFIGQFARKPRYQGGGSSHIRPYKVYNAYKASERYAGVAYADGYRLSQNEPDEELIREAVALAERSEVAVIFAGLTERMESEGYDRTHINLPRCQNKLISEVARVQKNTVVVLHNGSPVAMPWINDVNAVLEAYLAGEAGAEAENDILFGAVNPSGKLAETFPVALSDTPCYKNFPGSLLTVEHRESIFVGYRYYDRMNMDVLFPFGHGLSYTTFEYSNLELKSSRSSVEVSFLVKNTGERDGAEAAQIYVAKEGESIVFRAEKELKGFEKVYLKAGEEKKLTIILDEEAFEFYNIAQKCFCVEEGSYNIMVGASSRDIRLEASIDVIGIGRRPEIEPYNKAELVSYYKGNPALVEKKEFERLCGFKMPKSELDDEVFDVHSTLEQAQHTFFGKLILGGMRLVLSGQESLGSPDIMIAETSERPLLALAAMSNGMLTQEMAEAIASLLNNKKIVKSLGVLIKGGIKLLTGEKKGIKF